MPIAPGTKIGPYLIQAPLGSGGMGAVYQAHDPTLQRTVAIKVLAKQDEDASARLLQEARAASALNHPHICTIHEVGEHEGQAFIVMEHVEGKPLSALIPSDGLPPESVIRYGTQIADALAHAHERDRFSRKGTLLRNPSRCDRFHRRSRWRRRRPSPSPLDLIPQSGRR